MHLAIQIQNLQSSYNLSNENTISYNIFLKSNTIPRNTEFDLKDSILKSKTARKKHKLVIFSITIISKSSYLVIKNKNKNNPQSIPITNTDHTCISIRNRFTKWSHRNQVYNNKIHRFKGKKKKNGDEIGKSTLEASDWSERPRGRETQDWTPPLRDRSPPIDCTRRFANRKGRNSAAATSSLRRPRSNPYFNIFFFHCYFTIAIIDSIVLSRTFMTDGENLKLLNIDLAAEGSLTVEK